MPLQLALDGRVQGQLYEYCKDVTLKSYRNGANGLFRLFSSRTGNFVKNKVRILKNQDEIFCDYRKYARNNRLIDGEIRRIETENVLTLEKTAKRH